MARTDGSMMVRCRPGGSGWVLIFLMSGFLAFFTTPFWLPQQYPHQQLDISFYVFMGSIDMLLALGILAFTVYLLRGQVVADDAGLHWCGMRGWKEARWEEVTDYYEKRLPKGQLARVIETKIGKLLLTETNWNNLPALRDCVEQRAQTTQTRKWAERGKREHELWPYLFDYNTTDNRFLPRFLGTLGVLLVGCYVWMFVDKFPNYQRTIEEMGWGYGLGMIAFQWLVLLTPLFLLVLMLPLLSEGMRKRRKQCITATEKGLTFEEGEKRFTLPWQEITLFSQETRKGASLYHVVGKQTRFEFTHMIGEYRLLTTLIERFAPEAVERGRHAKPDVENLVLQDDVLIFDERVYHYRTRSNRALLWIPGAFALAFLLMLALYAAGWIHDANTITLAVMGTLLGLFTLWCWWRYRATSIRTDSLGITQFGLFGKQFVSWGDIQEYYISGDDLFTFGNIIGSRTRIRFWIDIHNLTDLKAEIQRRATYSRTTEWKPKGKS